MLRSILGCNHEEKIQENTMESASEVELKSSTIRRLLLEQDDNWIEPFKVTIPKIIVRYWHDSANLPLDVEKCLKSWNTLEASGFKLLLFNDTSADFFIRNHLGKRHTKAFRACGHPAMRCDYFRMCFMVTEGGFYVDADDIYCGKGWETLYRDDTLKVQPLCYDIPTAEMVATDELWQRDALVDGRIFYLNNNPLVSPPGHPILRHALERATVLLAGDGPFDIQATTGPGNLTASLVEHVNSSKRRDFTFVRNWHEIGQTIWDLSYRQDDRNWRNGGLIDRVL